MANNNDIVIYKTKDNEIELKVTLKDETVWLNAHMIADLFNVQRPAIVKHIQNIYTDAELDKESTCSILEQVAKDGKKRKMNYYNLDMIISVGYRVNSKRATHFRIWATNILREYLVNGYSINKKRLESDVSKYTQLNEYIKTLRNVIDNETITLDQSKELIRVISDYTEGMKLIDKTDRKTIDIPKNLTTKKAEPIDYKQAIENIESLKDKLNAHSLFGNEVNNGFKSVLQSIFQASNGKDLYPSVEEKASNLLYLIIKNHPFTDGNKRIGSFMFIRFLNMNGLLYYKDGSKLLEENALVAITLLIAQSDPKQKELMVRLVVHLIKRRERIQQSK